MGNGYIRQRRRYYLKCKLCNDRNRNDVRGCKLVEIVIISNGDGLHKIPNSWDCGAMTKHE